MQLQDGVTLTEESLEEYHQDFVHHSKSMISAFDADRDKFHRWYHLRESAVQPKSPSDKMDKGTVIHDVLLSGKSFEDMVVSYPETCLKSNKAINPGPAEEFRKANPGKIILKDDVVEDLRASIVSLMLTELGDVIAAAEGIENSFRWKDDRGLLHRCRPDIWCDMGDHIAAHDLKCSEDISDQGFRRSMYGASWWLQSPHYTEGLVEAFGKPVSFRFTSVEIVYPYRSFTRWLDPRSFELARDRRNWLLDEMATCYETGNWVNPWNHAVTLWPKWDD